MPQLFRDREYLRELLRAIERARRSFTARIFLIDPGTGAPSPVEEIFRTLQAAKKRGVQIQLESSGIFARKPSGGRLIRLARRFQIPMEWKGPPEFLHEKSAAIDGRVHFIGSHNWSPASLLENREITVKVGTEGSRLDAKSFRRELLKAVREAEKEITLATYEIEEVVESNEDFADELTRQLIFARMKKKKVRLILDASVVRETGGGDGKVTLYRGRRKAEELARWGVHVYYDTTEALFHAKLAVIDGEKIFIGSQNINPVREGEIEQTVSLRSRPLAREIKTYLAGVVRTSERFRYHPLQIPGVRIPLGWVRRGGAIAKIFQSRGVRTLELLLALLHETERLGSSEIPWDPERIAALAGIRAPRRFTPSVKNRRHYFERILTQPRLFLKRRGLLDYPSKPPLRAVRLLDGKGKFYERPSEDFLVLSWDYWKKGWPGRLTSGERYAVLVHGAELSASPEAPFWSSLTVRKISKRYGISYQKFSKQTVRLERWNLIDVDRDIKIGDPEAPKRPNRYRVNSFWSPAEEKAGLERLKKEFMAKERDLKEARALAERLNQPHDLEVIRKFLILLERYGKAPVNEAVRITARFKPHFALRNVHHTAAILRNWEKGIRR